MDFLAAKFSGEERHARRLAKMKAIERQYFKANGDLEKSKCRSVASLFF